MGTWQNDDGLRVKFGTSEAVHSKVGEYRHDGQYHVAEIVVDLDTLTDSPAALSDTVKIPEGAVIEKIEVIVLEEPTGTNAVLDVGTMQTDYTEYDFDGLLDGLTEAAMDDNVGILTTFVSGTSSTLGGASGADVGVFAGFTEPVLICAEYETAAFTAGRVAIRIYWSTQHSLSLDLDG